jgi:hypothetical protein
MAWEIFTREDKFNRTNTPFISISSSRICFSGPFVRLANIDNHYRTTIYTDIETLHLGFEFHLESRAYSLALNFDPKSENKKTGLVCSAFGVASKYEWVNAVTKLPPVNRRFFPKKEGKLWTIQIRPSFEKSYTREANNIPKQDNGVYRYIGKNNEVVYIGRGNILRRLKSKDRQSWDFEVVEYSVIDDKKEQVFRESYWLSKYIESNGSLPLYNKVSGAGITK